MKWIGGTYIQIGNDLFSKGKKITSCKQNNCLQNEKMPNILYDGKYTFYKWEILSWFDYSNFTVLDEINSVFTDKKKVYIQWKEFVDMDWVTFSHPKLSSQVFKDKNYTYTVNYVENKLQIQRILNK
jgi:hypothetical protein